MSNKKKPAKKAVEKIVPDQNNTEEIQELNNDNVEKVVENNEVNNEDVEFLPKIGIIGAPKVCVCIPFLQAAAQGNELKYALRSMQKNFREDFTVVIIGDRPDWLSNAALHIEHNCMSKNPQVDVIDKIKNILVTEEVSDKFVWTNDDIYFVSPVSLADIETLKIVGELKEMPKVATVYSANREKTIALLEKARLPTRNFATHLPIVFEKEKVLQLFEEFEELNEGGYLFSSVYFNRHFADWKPLLLDWVNDNWSLRLVSKNPDADKFKKIVNRSKWLNNAESGYSEFLEKYLEKRFPEKSIFEI